MNGQVRRKRERAQVPVDGAGVGIYERLCEPPRQEDHVAWQDMAEALARLPDPQRAAVLLVALEGMSYDEAADILAVPVGTVRSRLSRARETLRTTSVRRPGAIELRRVK